MLAYIDKFLKPHYTPYISHSREFFETQDGIFMPANRSKDRISEKSQASDVDPGEREDSADYDEKYIGTEDSSHGESRFERENEEGDAGLEIEEACERKTMESNSKLKKSRKKTEDDPPHPGRKSRSRRRGSGHSVSRKSRPFQGREDEFPRKSRKRYPKGAASASHRKRVKRVRESTASSDDYSHSLDNREAHEDENNNGKNADDDYTLEDVNVHKGDLVALPSAEDDHHSPFWIAKVIRAGKRETVVHWYDCNAPFGTYKPCFEIDGHRRKAWLQKIPNTANILSHGFHLQPNGKLNPKIISKIKKSQFFKILEPNDANGSQSF